MIPELGISSQRFLEDLSPRDQLDRNRGRDDAREITVNLRLPSNVASGNYDLIVVVFNADARSEETTTLAVGSQPIFTDGTVVGIDAVNKQVARGSGVVYTVSITNTGDTMKTYTAEAVNEEVFASSRVDPAVLSLSPGQTGSMNVFIQASESAFAGQHNFAIVVKESGNVIKTFTTSAIVTGDVVGDSRLRNSLIVADLILIVVLIALAIIIAATRRPEVEGEEGLY